MTNRLILILQLMISIVSLTIYSTVIEVMALPQDEYYRVVNDDAIQAGRLYLLVMIDIFVTQIMSVFINIALCIYLIKVNRSKFTKRYITLWYFVMAGLGYQFLGVSFVCLYAINMSNRFLLLFLYILALVTTFLPAHKNISKLRKSLE